MDEGYGWQRNPNTVNIIGTSAIFILCILKTLPVWSMTWREEGCVSPNFTMDSNLREQVIFSPLTHHTRGTCPPSEPQVAVRGAGRGQKVLNKANVYVWRAWHSKQP